MEIQKERNSGIELIKVIAIFIIITFHITQTLEGGNPYIGYSDYVIDLNSATTNLKTLILILFSHLGTLGNNLFFVCSAWFLLEKKEGNFKKVLKIMLDVWIISVLMLLGTYIIRNGNISLDLIVNSFFPIISSNNWYITAYLLFYMFHPVLNKCIEAMNQKELLKTATILFVLYCVISYVRSSFFSTILIIWMAVYFVIAYMKKYLPHIAENRKLNLCLLGMAIFGNIAIIVLTNILGQHIGFLSNKALYWNKNCSPFSIVIAISLLNLGRSLQFKSKTINRVSKLSLLIYIIHENILVRTYLRPYLWMRIYEQFGYQHLFGWLFLMVLVMFVLSLILSIIYEKTIQKGTNYICPKLYRLLSRVYGKYESLVMKRNW